MKEDIYDLGQRVSALEVQHEEFEKKHIRFEVSIEEIRKTLDSMRKAHWFMAGVIFAASFGKDVLAGIKALLGAML